LLIDFLLEEPGLSDDTKFRLVEIAEMMYHIAYSLPTPKV
jgi:hypothetical protein